MRPGEAGLPAGVAGYHLQLELPEHPQSPFMLMVVGLGKTEVNR